MLEDAERLNVPLPTVLSAGAAKVIVWLDGVDVAVAGAVVDVAVAGAVVDVAVAGTGVFDGGTGVFVGGAGVFVGPAGVLVGNGVSVASAV